MISDIQTKEIKDQIIKHIESTFPEDKKDSAINQIESMGSEQLGEFLEKNKLMQQIPQSSGEEQQCIFCSILSDKIPGYKIDGNKTSSAFLEINPISKGHIIVLPVKHSDKISKRLISFANKISKKMKSKLKPKNVLISQGTLFGHGIINLVPVYRKESLDSKRYKAEKDELEEVQSVLTKKTIRKPRTKKIKETKLWLPKRIP